MDEKVEFLLCQLCYVGGDEVCCVDVDILFMCGNVYDIEGE